MNGLHTNEMADSQEAWMLVLVLPESRWYVIGSHFPICEM